MRGQLRTGSRRTSGLRHRSSKQTTEDDTQFYECQIDGQSINYSYMDMPWTLLIWDLRILVNNLWAIPYVAWPLASWWGGSFDELYPSYDNLFTITIHSVLLVIQLAFLISLPLALFFPIYSLAMFMALFFLINHLFCLVLNGTSSKFYSEAAFTPNPDNFAHEKWVFLNGIGTG